MYYCYLIDINYLQSTLAFMYKNTRTSYGLIAIFFHWFSALTIIGLFGLGYWMVDLDYYSEWYRTGPHIHKSTGLLLLLLTLGRLAWKSINIKPEVIANNNLEALSARFAHALLYLLMLVIMISGYLISTADGRGIEVFDWFTVPSAGELFNEQEDISGLVHEYAAYAIICFAALHALAALKHHFINRDNTLTRMLKPNINRNH